MHTEDPAESFPEPFKAREAALLGRTVQPHELNIAPYEFVRRIAVDALQLRPGQCVLDLGCGPGLSLPLLRDAVGPLGRVVAVDAHPERLAQARLRAQRPDWSNVSLQCVTADLALLPRQADAVLLHFAHDVLQNQAAVDHLLRHLRAGARIAATGFKWTAPGLAPWNALVGMQIAQSTTRYEGLRSPWLPLVERGAQLEVDALVMGTVFFAHGVWPGRRGKVMLDERR